MRYTVQRDHAVTNCSKYRHSILLRTLYKNSEHLPDHQGPCSSRSREVSPRVLLFGQHLGVSLLVDDGGHGLLHRCSFSAQLRSEKEPLDSQASCRACRTPGRLARRKSNTTVFDYCFLFHWGFPEGVFPALSFS
ncbi:hypothetical protein CEXT_66751 [Caerostris extrusa]|uniref:Uncharacterized protein n=1 Tax=Caerostris extrusa TaxID=172846 RepID=A0AAV4MDP8_CAEEX|nr:hypothetical protein CEXT_66751 [Caerostris extrusa]